MNNLMQFRLFQLCMFFVSFRHLTAIESMGPFNVVFKEAGLCEDKGNGETELINPKLSKVGRDQVVLTSTAIVTHPVGHELGISIDVAIWGNGGWKKNFFLFEKDDFFGFLENTLPNQYEALLNQTHTEKLPIVPGSYELHVPMSQLKITNFQEVPYGKYSIEVNLIREKTISGCVAFKVDIVPKRVKKEKKKKN